MEDDELSLEERVQTLSVLLQAAIWGPHLHHRRHRRRIAADLYTRLEAAEPRDPFPPAVRAALYRHADALAELDNMPDALRPSLRSVVRSSGSDAG